MDSQNHHPADREPEGILKPSESEPTPGAGGIKEPTTEPTAGASAPANPTPVDPTPADSAPANPTSADSTPADPTASLDRSIFANADPATDLGELGFSPDSEGLNLPIRDSDGPLAFGKDRLEPSGEGETVVRERLHRRVRHERGASLRSLALAVAYIAAVILLGIWMGSFIIGVGNDLFAFTYEKDDAGNPVSYEVEITDAGMDAGEVGKLLKEKGVIKYDWAFRLYAELKKKDSFGVKAGVYRISAAANYDAIMSVINPIPPREVVTLTFTEGMNTDEIIDLLLENGIGTREGYDFAINYYRYDYWFMSGLRELSDERYYRLDGYLYPDTYQFFTDASEIAVIDKFLANFDRKFTEDYRELCEERGMSPDEIIRIASLVEAEAKRVGDYVNVASIFYNRLKSESFDGLLQSDASIQYYFRHVEGARHSEITPDDLKVETAYNSYLTRGLPPGAICNPSLNALRAALNPDESCPYYYFVSRPNGYMYYAKTLKEHNANIEQVRKENEDADNNHGGGWED